MKTRFSIGLAAVSLLLACQSHSYQIEGYARDFQDGDTICLVSEISNVKKIEQTTVTNGRFLMIGDIDSVCFCHAFVKNDPDSRLSFFLESGHIVLEFHKYPELSRVSGTHLNNNWQQLTDSVHFLSRNIINILRNPATEASKQTENVRAVDSLHRRISECITKTAKRNVDNPLGRFIHENYKAPEFK